MAAQALGVLQRHGRLRLWPKVDHSRERSATRIDMCSPRSVARLALKTVMAEGTLRVVGPGMLGAEDSGDAGIAMTPKTGIRALGAEARIRMRRPIG